MLHAQRHRTGLATRPLLSSFSLIAAAALVLSACAAWERGGRVAGPSADTIFTAAIVHTGDPANPRAQAVAVRDGRILAVGARADVARHAGPATERVDLGQAALFPGFVDAHAHLFGIGAREVTLNLEGVASLAELVTRLEAEVQGATDLVVGRGWIETHWPEGRMPTRDDLDAVAPDTPVFLVRADGHALVANSRALAAAGVDGDAADPDGGKIERDAAGRATGVLIDTAMEPVLALERAPEGQARDAILTLGADIYTRLGWTGVHSMSVDPQDTRRLEDLASRGDVSLRVVNAVNPGGAEALFATGPRVGGDGRITTRGVKVYVDGALGSRGAALAAPYADRPDTSGVLTMTEEEAATLFDAALRSGVQMNVHAIGDRGNTLALDWMETAFARVPETERALPQPRWRIEHAQILDVADIPRFAELGVIASMQPSHAIGDLHFAKDRLGPDRLAGAYAWRSLIQAGAVVAGGSDAPVERGDPLIEFYAAVARADLSGFQGPHWGASEAVSREDALKMFTVWPAYASFQEGDLGVIAPGMRADLSAFSGDLMSIPVADIPKQRAVMTVVDGDIVYDGRQVSDAASY